MQNIKVKSQKLRSGFTLMELVVASSLFMIVVAMATGTFVQSLKNQRDIRDLTSANNNAAQALESIAREIRTGREFQQSTSTELNFTNYRNEKVSYKLLGDNTIGRCVSGLGFCLPGDPYTAITSNEYDVTALKLYYHGIDEPDQSPPRITVSITIQGAQNRENTIQTTVSSKSIGT